jgi:hypothetical protein
MAFKVALASMDKDREASLKKVYSQFQKISIDDSQVKIKPPARLETGEWQTVGSAIVDIPLAHAPEFIKQALQLGYNVNVRQATPAEKALLPQVQRILAAEKNLGYVLDEMDMANEKIQETLEKHAKKDQLKDWEDKKKNLSSLVAIENIYKKKMGEESKDQDVLPLQF